MIPTTALTKSYDQMSVVRDVSLRCEPGTITGRYVATSASWLGRARLIEMPPSPLDPARSSAQ